MTRKGKTRMNEKQPSVRFSHIGSVLHAEIVGFMDSSGLGLIVGRLVTAKEVGCSLTLTGVDARTMKIFEMAGLERMRGLTIKPSEEKR